MDWGGLLSGAATLIAGLFAVYTYVSGKRRDERDRLRALEEKRLADERVKEDKRKADEAAARAREVDVTQEAYVQASGITKEILERLNNDIKQVSIRAKEREAYFVDVEKELKARLEATEAENALLRAEVRQLRQQVARLEGQ